MSPRLPKAWHIPRSYLLVSFSLIFCGCSADPPKSTNSEPAVTQSDTPSDATASDPTQSANVGNGGLPEVEQTESQSVDAATEMENASQPEADPPATASPEQVAGTAKTGSNSAAGGEDGASASKADDLIPESAQTADAWREWPTPVATLVITGQQNGYIEPCGCTGLDRQKGGIARRFTLIKQLREKGWPLVPLDAGNQVRRFGRQAEVKLQQSVKALQAMDYKSVGFGPDDLRLGVGELLSVAAGETPEETMFASTNVVLIDRSLMPTVRVVDVNGFKIGIASVLDSASLETPPSDEITLNPAVEGAMAGVTFLRDEKPDFRVLMFFGKEEKGKELVQLVRGYDIIVVAGGYGEPTYQPETIEGSRTRMIVTGYKGMYAGLVACYKDQPLKYARVPLTHEFEDAPEMRQIMKDYQEQLRDIGLEGLGLLPPIPHGSGQQFVGTAKCGECHTTALDIWQGTPHALATDDIVKPPKERGDIPRHFDPECLSCHVTGWNPQEFYPYQSGYLSLEQSAHLTGNGCENCHGPGSDHAAAEVDGSGVSQDVRDQLRESMKLPLAKAREKCMTCHDLDNSPDFHEEGAFEDIYWPEVEHYGKD